MFQFLEKKNSEFFKKVKIYKKPHFIRMLFIEIYIFSKFENLPIFVLELNTFPDWHNFSKQAFIYIIVFETVSKSKINFFDKLFNLL